MNGPEHYREAERLLGQINEAQIVHVDRDMSLTEVDELKARVEKLIGQPVVIAASGVRVDPSPLLAAAQVHATLALTAATAFGAISFPNDGSNADLWIDAVMSQ